MRAYVIDRYGGPERLELREVDVPEPKDGQIRVRVHATSINAADYRLMRADPFLVRLAGGIFRPKRWPVLGSDFSGVVDAIGPGVEEFSIGDRVFGNSFRDGLGAFAEQLVVRTEDAVRVPDGISHEHAAAAPLAGITALQALRDLGRVGRGDSVLVQGAGGGVGNFAVQITRELGGRVTAVCGPGSVDLMRRWQVDEIIDYEERDFTAEDSRHDVIVGVNGYYPLRRYRESLAEGGRYVMVGGGGRQLLEAMLLGAFVFAGSGKTCATLQIDDDRRPDDLAFIAEALARGAIESPVDRTYPFEDLPEAIRFVESGHVKGKVVVCHGS